jgi:hypothetical protein
MPDLGVLVLTSGESWTRSPEGQHVTTGAGVEKGHIARCPIRK